MWSIQHPNLKKTMHGVLLILVSHVWKSNFIPSLVSIESTQKKTNIIERLQSSRKELYARINCPAGSDLCCFDLNVWKKLVALCGKFMYNIIKLSSSMYRRNRCYWLRLSVTTLGTLYGQQKNHSTGDLWLSKQKYYVRELLDFPAVIYVEFSV